VYDVYVRLRPKTKRRTNQNKRFSCKCTNNKICVCMFTAIGTVHSIKGKHRGLHSTCDV